MFLEGKAATWAATLEVKKSYLSLHCINVRTTTTDGSGVH